MILTSGQLAVTIPIQSSMNFVTVTRMNSFSHIGLLTTGITFPLMLFLPRQLTVLKISWMIFGTKSHSSLTLEPNYIGLWQVVMFFFFSI